MRLYAWASPCFNWIKFKTNKCAKKSVFSQKDGWKKQDLHYWLKTACLVVHHKWLYTFSCFPFVPFGATFDKILPYENSTPFFVSLIKDVTAASQGANSKWGLALLSAVRSHNDLDFPCFLPPPDLPLLASVALHLSPLSLYTLRRAPWVRRFDRAFSLGCNHREADVSQAAQKHHSMWWHLSLCSQHKSLGSLMRKENF